MCMFLVIGENNIPTLYSVPFYIGEKNQMKKIFSFYVEDNLGVILYVCDGKAKELTIDMAVIEGKLISID